MCSPTSASTHTPFRSYPWFNELIDQPTALVVNPPLFPIGNHFSHYVDLGLSVFGNVPCDLPRKVVGDALAMSLGSGVVHVFQGWVLTIVSILCIIGH